MNHLRTLIVYPFYLCLLQGNGEETEIANSHVKKEVSVEELIEIVKKEKPHDDSFYCGFKGEAKYDRDIACKRVSYIGKRLKRK